MQERDQKKIKPFSFQAEVTFFPPKRRSVTSLSFSWIFPKAISSTPNTFNSTDLVIKEKQHLHVTTLYQPTNPHFGAIIPCSLPIRAKV